MMLNYSAFLIVAYFLFSVVMFFMAKDVKGLSACFSILCAIIIFCQSEYFSSRKKTFIIAVLLFIFTVVFQFSVYSSYSYLEFFGALSWLICPLCVYFILNGRRIFIRLLAILWLLNLIASVRQLFFAKSFVGLPGNLNWHASLTLGLAPIVIYLLHIEWKRREELFYMLCKYLVVVFTLFTIFKTESRAAIVSAILALILLAYFYSSDKKIYRKFFFLSLSAIFAGAILILILFFGHFVELLRYDMRLAMWTGALRLFNDNICFGVGDARYLSEYTAYRPIGYFLRSHHFAHITEHPHNHVLYMLGSFGVIGGGAILLLTIYPIFFPFFRYFRLSLGSRAVLFSFLLFFICSLFDMTYYHWHNFFSMSILLGLLWKISYPVLPSKRSFSLFVFFSFGYISRAICAMILIFIFVKSNIDTYRANIYYNTGYVVSDDPERSSFSLSCMTKSAEYNPNFSLALFSAGILSIQNFKDPYMAQFYLDKLLETPNPSISRSNLKMADAKIALGRNLEALSYLEKDLINYPISIESLYKKFQIEEKLGLEGNLYITSLMLARAIEHKGLLWDDVPIIAKNPYFDNKFEEYKELKRRLVEEQKLK